ncbi:hypothetical protein R1sor_024104 [Riccia sorocarpa]|uniref:Transferrin-like domain-containing protein n=1 Tax=Riccia sorocarpa TaxID=122646 RepID=A0ABD3GPP1_9MARC
MKPPVRILLLVLLMASTTAEGPLPSPSPAPASVPAPAVFSSPVPAPASPAPSPRNSPGSAPAPAPAPSNGTLDPRQGEVIWCAVREEFDDCLTYMGLLSGNLNWTCVMKEDKGECMDAIRNGEADLISVEAGYAYTAFRNRSMKAILSEEYSFHAGSYAAVAVVRKEMCDRNPHLTLENFRHLKSCHPGYQTSGGWNYPVLSLLKMGVDPRLLNTTSIPNDVKTLTRFFSASCAPSELGYGGICSGCGNQSICSGASTVYAGEPGAFRCLMDGTGDIAFLRARTPQLYSSDGLNSQEWSTKSVDQFIVASVPANPIMTWNGMKAAKKNAIVTALLNANWTSALYTGKNWENHVLSVSTQALAEVKQFTRSYLATSGAVSKIIQDLNHNIMIEFSGSLKTSKTTPVLSMTVVILTSWVLHFFLS